MTAAAAALGSAVVVAVGQRRVVQGVATAVVDSARALRQ